MWSIRRAPTHELIPGAQAFEVARRLTEPEVAAFEDAVRADTSVDPDGYADFAVHPKVAGEVRWVVELIEPMEQNLQAFGLDLAAEAERRSALLDAIDDDEPRTTAPIRLVQEPTDQTGLLVVLPIYHVTSQPTDIFERRRTAVGLIFITHSVDEAVFPANRIVVMSGGPNHGRPGSTAEVVPIDLPYPRDVTSPEFNDIKRHLIETLHRE